ncbi:BTB/POZ domain-containing protein [Euphorbia peplus]|nr:BTB/POZ domain-containing protein [Euphorbia peplus]
MMPLHPKKRQRVTNTPYLSVDSSNKTISLTPPKLRRTSSHPILSSSSSAATTSAFNDPNTADVILRIFLDPTAHFFDFFDADESVTFTDETSDVQIYLHSQVLNRAKYFSALLSDRWKHNSGIESSNADLITDGKKFLSLKLGVPPIRGAVEMRLTVLELLYTDDFSTVINSVSMALDVLPVALELLFEDCVKVCVKFLEAVPWTEEEEKRVITLVPLLSQEESEELLARLLPGKDDSCEEMLHGLILSAIHNHQNMAFVKAFVAKLLREFSSRESARRVLERAFQGSLKIVKESLEEYSSPDFRGDHNETEAIQRLHLHTALTNGKHLLWLVERMIELRVADNAVKEWSEQASFTANLQRAFRDDAWRNIVPGLPAVVVRCTSKLAHAVANGTILAARQVRMRLVKDWLPVLIVCKDNLSPMSPGHKSMYMELEETFLRIISTLPMPEAQELLQQCLSFSTRNVEDCPHLVSAFNTWFRRAMQSSWRNSS